MSIELEVLDQLAGGDMRIAVMLQIFASHEQARTSLSALFASGDIQILDACGSPIEPWRWKELCRQPESAWAREIADMVLSATPQGLDRIL